MNKKILICALALVSFLAVFPGASALACIAMAGEYETTAVKGQPYYFSFTVYNTDATPQKCDDGIYSIDLKIENEDLRELFDYSVSENDFLLHDSQTRRIMVTVTPKTEAGEYNIYVVATRNEVNDDKGGSKFIATTQGTIKMKMAKASEETEEMSTMPEWYEALKEQEAEEQPEKEETEAPQKPTGFIAFGALESLAIPILAIALALIAIVVLVKRLSQKKRNKLGYQ